jgi:hypothetical protein
MNGLRIEVLSVQPEVAAFTYCLRVALAGADEPVESIRLRAQVQIQPARRRYSREEQTALEDLFGTPERWGTTLRPLYWTNVQMQIPSFHLVCEAGLRVPWPGDANDAATRYLHALQTGEIPVELLFSGNIFFRSRGNGSKAGVQVAFIPWSLEAACRIPEDVWSEVRQHVERQEGSRHRRVRAGLSWDQLLNEVLAAGKEPKP